MAIKCIYSSDQGITACADDLRRKTGDVNPAFVIYFASSAFDPAALTAAMSTAFAGARLIGCTTAGEIVSGKMLKNAVAAMVFDTDAVSEISIQVVENISNENRVRVAFDAIAGELGTPMDRLSFTEYVGLVLVDGMRGAEERLMESIGDLTDVHFIGGSAGDDLAFRETWVFADGKAYSDAAVLAVIKPTNGFDFIKTQSFCSTGRQLEATEVDEKSRTVIAFNDQPAIDAYASALGLSVEQAKDRFMTNPLGLMVDQEPFVRSPQQVVDRSMKFYCEIKNGMSLDVLESQDIVADTRNAVAAKRKELGSIGGIVNFHCILRTLELEQKGQTEQYAEIFREIPTVGFSTYGEEFIGHINQTSTMLVLK